MLAVRDAYRQATFSGSYCDRSADQAPHGASGPAGHGRVERAEVARRHHPENGCQATGAAISELGRSDSRTRAISSWLDGCDVRTDGGTSESRQPRIETLSAAGIDQGSRLNRWRIYWTVRDPLVGHAVYK